MIGNTCAFDDILAPIPGFLLGASMQDAALDHRRERIFNRPRKPPAVSRGLPQIARAHVAEQSISYGKKIELRIKILYFFNVVA